MLVVYPLSHPGYFAEHSDEEDAYSEGTSDEEDQLEAIESEDAVPASSSPASSSPIAATPEGDSPNTSTSVAGLRGAAIQSRNFHQSGVLSSAFFKPDDEKGSAFFDAQDVFDELHEVQDEELVTARRCSPAAEPSVDPSFPRPQNDDVTCNLTTVSSDEVSSTDCAQILSPPLPSSSQSPFLLRLNELLQAVQEEQREEESRRRSEFLGDAMSHAGGSSVDTQSQSGPSSVSASSISVARSLDPASYPSHFDCSPASSSDYWACFETPGIFANVNSEEPGQCDADGRHITPPSHSQTCIQGKEDIFTPTTPSKHDSNNPTDDHTQYPATSSHTQDKITAKRSLSSISSKPSNHVSGYQFDLSIGAYTQVSEGSVHEHALKKRKVSLLESRFFARRRSSMATSGINRVTSSGVEGNMRPLAMYARKPASLRRAESLRSDLSYREDVRRVSTKPRDPLCPSLLPACFTPSGSATPTSHAFGYVPTEPSTPVARSPELIPSSLPIIAPPPFELIPREPLSGDEAAERRLRVLLEKERQERLVDQLPCREATEPRLELVAWNPNDEDGSESGSCESSTADEDDITDSVTPEETADDERSELGSQASDVSTESEHGQAVESIFSRAPQLVLGIEEDLRKEAIEWILDVLPPVIPTKRHFCMHLHDQLSTSDETRFHAAYLFTRYFLHIGRSPASSPASSISSAAEVESELECEGRKALTRDVALACLALCVKFHRDALFPLYIILADEFLALAPHALTDEDFESAQRDVFEVLSFSLGSTTPAAFMQELWDALPSLRVLLAFDGGWAAAQAEAWAVLLEALLESDVLRFPSSLLTAAALLEGIEEALVRRRPSAADSTRMRKGAVRAMRHVTLDVLEVLGYAEEDLACCRRWLHYGN